MAPEPPKRRAPSSPELPRTITGAEQPEQWAVRHHPGLDGEPQPPPRRSPTLTAMPAPPPLPLEHARTVPAVAHTAPTQRAPTPATGIRIPSDETPASEPPGASVQAERDRAELAEFRRRERVRVEAAGPNSWPPKVQRSQSPVPSSDSIRADGTVQSLRKAQTRLYLALAAFVALAAYPTVSWLQSAAEVKAQSQRADVKANAATTVADSAKATATDADKELTKLRDEFRLYRANMREVMRLQGIDMPRHPDDPDPNDLKPVTPYCPRGKVCTGPQLVLQVAP